MMFWIPAILLGLAYFIFEFCTTQNWLRVIIVTVLGFASMGIIIGIDYAAKTRATEVRSGYIEDWSHDEEWDEWIPPSTTCTTDSKGKQSCTTTPGYWVHHDAENHIKTTDDGWIYVSRTPDGRRMDDSFPNHKSELEKMFPYKTPTASTHAYTNKVQASYSIYKHPEIDLNKFPDLPKYPSEVQNYFYVDRIVGKVPNKMEALKVLAQKNTELNKMVPDPEKPGKKRSWKQVNLIFVNVGDKPEDYGFALQDAWQGGNKNDFVVAFSMKKDGTLNWVYPFSWSEVEILKIEIRDFMMEQKEIKDFVPIVEKVSEMVADKFERKQFEDFNYLHIEPSNGALITIWVMNILIGAIGVWFSVAYRHESYNNRRSF